MLNVGEIYIDNDYFWYFFITSKEVAEKILTDFIKQTRGYNYPKGYYPLPVDAIFELDPGPTTPKQRAQKISENLLSTYTGIASIVEPGDTVICLEKHETLGLYKLLTCKGEIGWAPIEYDLLSSFKTRNEKVNHYET